MNSLWFLLSCIKKILPSYSIVKMGRGQPPSPAAAMIVGTYVGAYIYVKIILIIQTSFPT